MSSSLRFLHVVGLVAPIVLAVGRAHAESAVPPPSCRVDVLPLSTSTVPANLPAFVVEDLSAPGLIGSTTPPVAAPALDLEVLPDPREPHATLWRPRAAGALQSGVTYTIDYTEKCSVESGAPPVPQRQVSYTVGANAPLPTTLGTASVLPDGTAVVSPSAELKAYLPVTHFEVAIDGKPAGVVGYGIVNGAQFDVVLRLDGVSVDGSPSQPPTSYAACTSGAGTDTHDVSLLAHVAGATNDPPPVTLQLKMGCDVRRDAGTLPDGGGDDRGASGGADDAPESGGCSASGTTASSSALLFALGGALAISARRRRFRRAHGTRSTPPLPRR